MAKKKSSKTTSKARGQKRTPLKRKAGAGARAMARTAGGRSTGLTGRRKSAGAKSPKGKAKRKKASNPPRPGTRKAAPRGAKTTRKTAAARTARTGAARKSARKRAGGTGREKTLAQTPQTGRSVRGRTNPMPTRRSTGTAAGAGGTRHAPGLDRERKRLRELEESLEGPPSSLDMDRTASAARSGRRHMQDTINDHTETSPAISGGDVDADWQEAYAVGDEAPGGDNPTPDQDRVDDIGKALGVIYEDNEELKGSDKIAERDKHRWELDPASSDDYRERD
jgi:hypothetical protein